MWLTLSPIWLEVIFCHSRHVLLLVLTILLHPRVTISQFWLDRHLLQDYRCSRIILIAETMRIKLYLDLLAFRLNFLCTMIPVMFYCHLSKSTMSTLLCLCLNILAANGLIHPLVNCHHSIHHSLPASDLNLPFSQPSSVYSVQYSVYILLSAYISMSVNEGKPITANRSVWCTTKHIDLWS